MKWVKSYRIFENSSQSTEIESLFEDAIEELESMGFFVKVENYDSYSHQWSDPSEMPDVVLRVRVYNPKRAYDALFDYGVIYDRLSTVVSYLNNTSDIDIIGVNYLFLDKSTIKFKLGDSRETAKFTNFLDMDSYNTYIKSRAYDGKITHIYLYFKFGD